MYQGKRLQKKTASGLRWRGKNVAMLVPALVLLLAISVGGTAAFLVAKDDPIANVFNPSKVSCRVNEDGFDGGTKSNVTIENTGDTEAYIRAAIVVTWKDTAGNVYAGKPVAGMDYSITLNTEDWVHGSDGFYYYKRPVAKDAGTTVLIRNCAPVQENTPDGYGLNVEILGSAIQSVPAATVENSWDVTVTNGEISE